jgi:hypothetical protein
MGIGSRLRRVETVDRAREEPKSAMTGLVRDAVANRLGRLDGFRVACGADGRHSTTKAELDAVAASGWVGVKGSIVLYEESMVGRSGARLVVASWAAE